MTTNGDFGDLWGLKIMGTPGKIIEVIHHLSPKAHNFVLKMRKFH